MNTEDLLLKRNIVVTPEQVEIIKNVIAKGATDDELKLFIFDCQRRGVHPLDKMIYFVKRKGKDGEHIGTHQASIDYFRSTAEESGDYAGQDEPSFEGETQEGYPEIARVNIYRKGINRPFVGVAYWKEYYPGESLGFMWRKMPHVMLAKCAEVNGFRKAFPKKLSGLYISEELEQAYNNAPQSGKPGVQQPQSKSQTETLSIKTTVQKITKREGINKKTGAIYNLYTIVGSEGQVYTTFDENFATLAKSAQEAGLMVEIKYTTDQYGNKVAALEMLEPNLEVAEDLKV